MKYLSAIIFAIAIVVASIFLGNAYADRNKVNNRIEVTGLGKADFSSDLIVWEGRFGAQEINLKQAYITLEQNKATIDDYLSSKGINDNQLIYSAVKTNQKNKQVYSENGNYVGEEFVGYELTQSIKIESKDVDKIEKLSREITELKTKA